MNTPSLQTGAVIRLEDTGYGASPYIQVDHKTCPVIFFWWADTPTGRQSRYWQSFTAGRLRPCGKMLKDPATGHLTACYVPTAYYAMPLQKIRDVAQQRACLAALPEGYVWQGPFLKLDIKAPTAESSSFRLIEPEFSDGINLSFLVTRSAGGETVLDLARKILAARQRV